MLLGDTIFRRLEEAWRRHRASYKLDDQWIEASRRQRRRHQARLKRMPVAGDRYQSGDTLASNDFQNFGALRSVDRPVIIANQSITSARPLRPEIFRKVLKINAHIEHSY